MSVGQPQRHWGGSNDPRAVPALTALALLDNADSGAAVRALGQIGGRQAIEALCVVLTKTKWYGLVATMLTSSLFDPAHLSEMKQALPALADALIALWTDTSPIWAISKEAEEVATAINKLDPDWITSEAAKTALSTLLEELAKERQLAANLLRILGWQASNDVERGLFAAALGAWGEFADLLGAAAIPRLMRAIEVEHQHDAAPALEKVLARSVASIDSTTLSLVAHLENQSYYNDDAGMEGWGSPPSTIDCSSIRRRAKKELARRGLKAL